MNKEARMLIGEIEEISKKFKFEVVEGQRLKVTCAVYENWFFKNGTMVKKDVANREKFLIDSVFKGLEIDDRFIWEIIFKKVQSETEEKAEVYIEVLADGV